MNDDGRLGRKMRDALPADLQTGPVLERIRSDLSSRPRRRHRLPRSRALLAGMAGLAALLVALGLLDGEWAPVSANVGRVEFLGASPRSVEFLSSQAQPADEYEAMKTRVLAGFNGTADFSSQTTAAQDIARIRYEEAAGSSTVDLLALTYSDMLALQASGDLEDLTSLLPELQQDRQFPKPLLADARFGTGRQYAIPWLQGTYLMAVNKKALPYLPPGADVHHLTYDQLVEWGQIMQSRTRQNRIGLPADVSGPQGGLVYRFLQGYTYPSYTRSTLTGFASPAAVPMWKMLQQLWAVTNLASAGYDSMSGPLLAGDVWVAWDHQARLAAALADSKDFIAVPAPAGPEGQGYMTAEVELAIPKGAPNPAGARALIEWLTRPAQQAEAAASLGFFPVVQGVQLAGPQAPSLAVDNAYRANRSAIETLPPAGLGSGTDAFTGVYQDAFSQIVLNNQDIGAVLRDDAPRLRDLVDAAGARCWRPDPPSRGPCRIP